jgi:hypothetical protein
MTMPQHVVMFSGAFRDRIDQQGSLFDTEDWGDCSCMAPAARP